MKTTKLARKKLTQKYKLHIKDVFADVYEDDYENGEGDRVNGFDQSVNKSFDNINDLLEYLSKKVIYRDITRGDCSVIDNRIHTSVLVDEDNSPVFGAQMEKWKAGKIKLYSANYNIPVYFVREVEPTEEELIDLLK